MTRRIQNPVADQLLSYYHTPLFTAAFVNTSVAHIRSFSQGTDLLQETKKIATSQKKQFSFYLL
jgi:hypothetical protein